MTVVADIETNGLIPELTKMWVGCTYCIETDEKKEFFCPVELTEYLNSVDLIVLHNGIGFDLPALLKLTGTPITTDIYDTFIASKIKYTTLAMIDVKSKRIPANLTGSHGLKAWGYRLGELKGEYGQQEDAWDVFREEMVTYCHQDVKVTTELYKRLLSNPVAPKALALEQAFKKIIVRQENFGWYFNVKEAQRLHVELTKDAEIVEKEVAKTFKPLPTWYPMKRIPQYTKKGAVNKVYQAQIDKGAHEVNGAWGRYEDLVFNPGSRHHIARWLQELYGWTPSEHTDKGSIIINEKVLNTLEFEEGKLLAHYFNVRKLIGQLAEGDNAWLKSVRDDSRIYGSVDTLGAVTRRCTHRKPNLAQVPSSRAYKGHECRALFTVPKGKKLVGCDADGLELRTLSHYLSSFDDGEYGRIVHEGKKENKTDIHSENQRAAGLSTRDEAKTFIYAFLYGAGDEKLGTIVGGGIKEGKALKRRFFSKIPAIKKLIKKVKETAEKNGFLFALDGGKFFIRSSHSALNTLLQGAGALVMKQYLINLDEQLSVKYRNSSNHNNGSWTDTSIQYEFVGNIHDEVQIECDEEIADDVARIAEDAFKETTRVLNFRIPLVGSAAIGDSWAETH